MSIIGELPEFALLLNYRFTEHLTDIRFGQDLPDIAVSFDVYRDCVRFWSRIKIRNRKPFFQTKDCPAFLNKSNFSERC